MTLVIDASVAAKWVLADSPREHDTERAVALLRQIANDGTELLQPEHWRVEVLSVIARLAPERFEGIWRLLESLNIKILSSKHVLERAAHLSNQLRHHLFDTLYHSIALEHGVALITADDIYFGKACRLGNIKLLTNLT